MSQVLPSEITPESKFYTRRKIIKTLGIGSLTLCSQGLILPKAIAQEQDTSKLASLNYKNNLQYSEAKLGEKLTTFKDITHYNNFYEFGTDKTDPSEYSGSLRTRPWSVSIEGMVNKPQVIDIDSLLKLAPLEERVYRMRCVEGWSMVIPWIGYPLTELIKKVQPVGSAKYIHFISLADPKQMRALGDRVIDWPYSEGLRLDEAMNNLTLLTFGLYGKVLPNQDGAPIRVVVPWKYGFKSAKSIVKIIFTDKEPPTSWDSFASHEYGFYSNVNPHVDHPRWSQATERRIGESFFTPKRPTLMFNGYTEEVAHLYTGMDLKKYF